MHEGAGERSEDVRQIFTPEVLAETSRCLNINTYLKQISFGSLCGWFQSGLKEFGIKSLLVLIVRNSR